MFHAMSDLQMFKIKNVVNEKVAEKKTRKKTAKCSFISHWSLVIMSPRGTERTCDRGWGSIAVFSREGNDTLSMKYIICANILDSPTWKFQPVCVCAHSQCLFLCICMFKFAHVSVCLQKCVSVFTCICTQWLHVWKSQLFETTEHFTSRNHHIPMLNLQRDQNQAKQDELMAY